VPTHHPFSLSSFAHRAQGPDLGVFLSALSPALADVDGGDPVAVVRAVTALPDDVRGIVEQQCEFVHEVASNDGLRIAHEEAVAEGIDLSEPFTEHLNPYHKAIWLWQDQRAIFNRALLFLDVDQRSGSSWYPGSAPQGEEPEVDNLLLASLGRAFESHLVVNEGRGQHCVVEHYQRGGLHIFIAYAEDFPETGREVVAGKWELRLRSPAFEMVIVVNPAAAVMDIRCHQGKRKAAALREVFGFAVYGRRLPADDPELPTWAIEQMVRPDWTFALAPGGLLQRAEVIAVKVKESVAGGAPLEYGRRRGETVYQTLARHLATTPDEARPGGRFPLWLMEVVSVRVKVDLRPVPGEKQRPARRRWISAHTALLGHEGPEAAFRQLLVDNKLEVSHERHLV